MSLHFTFSFFVWPSVTQTWNQWSSLLYLVPPVLTFSKTYLLFSPWLLENRSMNLGMTTCNYIVQVVIPDHLVNNSLSYFIPQQFFDFVFSKVSPSKHWVGEPSFHKRLLFNNMGQCNVTTLLIQHNIDIGILGDEWPRTRLRINKTGETKEYRELQSEAKQPSRQRQGNRTWDKNVYMQGP